MRPGKLFSVGVGDGCAFYVVTRVTKKTATVEWRGYHMDRWYDQVLGGGGTFPIDCIEPLVRWADSNLFRPKLKKLVPKSGKRKANNGD